MISVWVKMSELSREHGCAACRVDNPSATSRAFRAINNSSGSPATAIF